jgi:hypothetical protein
MTAYEELSSRSERLDMAGWRRSYLPVILLAPPPRSAREAPNTDRSELAGSADTAGGSKILI